jgi:hypothetical protein
MASPLYNQLGQGQPAQGKNLIQQIADFKKTFTGNPQQAVQQLINSGRISQQQVNQYAQQANQIYNQIKGLR